MACKLVVIGIFFVCFLVFCNVRVNGRNTTLSEEEDIEIERKLKILNKPPVKTLQIDGITFDCIDIHKQPALDHPLLINHTIQMRPSSIPVERNLISVSSTELFGSTFERTFGRKGCPPGTVIIRRTKKEDLINSKFFSTFTWLVKPEVSSPVDPTSPPDVNHYYASFQSYGPHPLLNFYGLKGSPTLHGLPGMPKSHKSSVFATLASGENENFNSIQAGWAVSPSNYGDDRTHFTIVWTTDGFRKEGCINLLCPGFVQVARYFTPGFAFRQSELSVYNGEQRVFPIVISKDKDTGNWWLMIGPKKTPIGYWPDSLLKGFVHGATIMFMGGIAYAPENEPCPPMGAGHFPEDGWRKASRFEDIQYLDVYNDFETPATQDRLVDDPACYSVGNYDERDNGINFYFGGPGGCINH